MDDQQKRMLEELLFSGEKKLSFAKLLFFGAFHAPAVLPFPNPSSDVIAEGNHWVERVNTFANSFIDGAAIDKNGQIPSSLIHGLGDIGLLGFTVSPTYGGQGLSQYTYCRAMAALACHCGSTALFVNAHHSIGLKALVLFGTEEQRQRWLPSLTSGRSVAAFSLTEPNAGSDASAVETRATYDPVKKVYRINGQKQWTTNGSMADVLTVMAQTSIDTPDGPRDKITAFLVTPDMPGFHVKDKALEKVGMRGTWTANLTFTDMEVPEANILGPKGAGLKVCLTVLDYGRTTFGATCAGQAQMLVKMAIAHARDRIQFKRPLTAFPLIQKKIVEMAALAYAMESTALMTAGLVDRGLEDFMLEAAILKVFNSEALWGIIYDTMQIYGGRSFFTSTPLERMMRDARLNMIGEGANEVLRAFIAAVGLRDVGLQLKGVADAVKSPVQDFAKLKAFGRQLLGHVWSPTIPLKSADIASEGRQLADLVRRFGVACTKALAKYREGIVDQQLVLDRLASIVIALYTMTAVLSRMDSELSSFPTTEKTRDDLACAKFYCQMASRNASQLLAGLFDPQDEQISKLSDQLTRR